MSRFLRPSSRKAKRNQPARASAQPRKFRPTIEHLETRTLLANNLLVTFTPSQFFSQGFYGVEFTVQGHNEVFGVGLLPIVLSNADGSNPQPEFESLCADALHQLRNTAAKFLVTPTPANTGLHNGGEISYLYNHYGFQPYPFSYTTPDGFQTSSFPLARAVGLQLAIWELEYGLTDASFSPVTQFTTQAQLNNALQYADAFFAEAQGKNENAIFLDATLGGTVTDPEQGLLAPLASPAIATTASETAGGVVGSAVLSDSVKVTGGDSPTGTITFTLTAPDGKTITVGSVTINGDGTYSAPTVIATEVGTYTWHASYAGDALNNGASDNGADESLTTVSAPSSPAAPMSGTSGASAVRPLVISKRLFLASSLAQSDPAAGHTTHHTSLHHPHRSVVHKPRHVRHPKTKTRGGV